MLVEVPVVVEYSVNVITASQQNHTYDSLWEKYEKLEWWDQTMTNNSTTGPSNSIGSTSITLAIIVATIVSSIMVHIP